MKSMMKRLPVFCACVAMIVVTAVAQETEPVMQGKAAERVEQFKKIRMMEVLGMDEQTSLKFFARYNKNLEVMKDLRQQQIKALGQIQTLRKEKASENDYAKVIRDLRSLEEQVHQTKSNYIDDLKDVLTNKQLAEYLVFELRFQQNLRELVRDAQQKKNRNP
jgi:hypothetical protein